MVQVDYIRRKFFEEGCSFAEISKDTGYDVKTVKKYIFKEDFSFDRESDKIDCKNKSKLDPFKETIDGWLEEDKKARKKQRHTAKRVHARLKEIHKESFDCSYRLVADYVSKKKKQVYGKRDSYLPLVHIPGEAQVDFGEADFYERDQRFSGYYVNISFPYSNGGYTQVFKGQNMQCLAQGLKNIFHHIGGVPSRIWFDNASTVVKKILKGGERELTQGFYRFKNHYGFQAAFCNPNSGHEKGSVESKVGYHRRNFFVPMPRFNSLEEYNQTLLQTADEDMKRPHYNKNELIVNLLKEDKQAFLLLPTYEYDESEIITVKTNGYGKFILKGRHTYSTAPRWANTEILVKLTAHEVIAMDKSYIEIDRHPRLYGEEKKESMHWIPYLTQLSRRPTALKYSGIYEMLPGKIKDLLDTCDYNKKKDILSILSTLSKKSSFEKAVEALLESMKYGADDTDSITVIFNRLNHQVFDFSSFKTRNDLPTLPKISSKSTSYDDMLMRGGIKI